MNFPEPCGNFLRSAMVIPIYITWALHLPHPANMFSTDNRAVWTDQNNACTRNNPERLSLRTKMFYFHRIAQEVTICGE